MKSTFFASTAALLLASAALAAPTFTHSPSDSLGPLTIEDQGENNYFAPSTQDSRGTFSVRKNDPYCFELKGSVAKAFPSPSELYISIFSTETDNMVYEVRQPLCKGLLLAPSALNCPDAKQQDDTIRGCVDLGESVSEIPGEKTLGIARIDFLESKSSASFFSAEGSIIF
ncbi:hypothetical protein BGZ65_004594 [Modicella reniformis]|uniref:Uncharacterized protein n=1 Tax=Modicella reniformis TaxID=1440133 RepID=A0A9P6IY97_9FUNG|nr:hypothetical protein BGZ65_004594 [Modicella reniformis]